MALRTVYCVQAFVRRGRELARGASYAFPCAVEAEDAGKRLARHVDGVLVFAQEGDPDFDVWDEPVIFAKHGEVPRLEF